MSTSQNGWPASPDLKRRTLSVNGVEFVGGIVDNDDVYQVLHYFWTQFDARVEKLVNPGCWGFYYRANRNDPTSLSNHSSGTATDGNAPKHPNGVATSKTFSAAQIAEVHKILAELDHVLRWGGDYTHTVDAMHVEVNVSPATLAPVAARLRAAATPKPAPAPAPVKSPTGGPLTDKVAADALAVKKANKAGTPRWKAAVAIRQQLWKLLRKAPKRG